jgi:nicotinamide-nucleotide amidase
MKIEIINIGNELLIGQVVNSNASWMAEQLNLAGFSVGRVTIIRDHHDEILEALEEAGKRAPIVLITGGLGPTKDDITKKALCEFFDAKLIFSEEAYLNIERLFGSRGYQITEPNRQQAFIPENCIPIPNYNGTAPGMWFEGRRTADGGRRTADSSYRLATYVSMPGVPFEMKAMMTDEIIPRLKERFPGSAIVHRTVLTQGVGESFLSETLEPWETRLPREISLAYLPQPGIVRLRLTGSGSSEEKIKKAIDEEIRKLQELIPEYIFGYDEETLEEIVGKMLAERGATLATAESCTGGYIAHLLTSIPGSSRYFRGSFVVYSNDLKEEVLGVLPESLKKYGAVSETVVTEMAIGAQTRLNADYVIAVSGIAGPDGGTKDKPVGTTWIAIATPEEVFARKLLFGEHRGRNIRRAALEGLNMLRKTLTG